MFIFTAKIGMANHFLTETAFQYNENPSVYRVSSRFQLKVSDNVEFEFNLHGQTVLRCN